MTCDEHKGRVSAWFDGFLDESAFQYTFEHLKECSTCRAFMTQLPRQVLLMRSLRPRELDSSDLGVERRRDQPTTYFTTERFSAPLAAAAAILLILLTIGVELNLSAPDPSRQHGGAETTEVRHVGGAR